MIKIFTILCMIFMPIMANAAKSDTPEQRLNYAVYNKNFSEVQSAIADGAKNVRNVLSNELYKARKDFCNLDFDVLNALMGADQTFLSYHQTDEFLYQMVYYQCTTDKFRCPALKSFSIRNILDISKWDYKAYDTLLEKIASIATDYDDKPNIIMCVFDQVSKSKLAGIEFLDYAEHVADTQNAVNTKAIINSLRDEIDRKRNEQ